MAFVHLHVHTQYSILDGLSSISGLFKRASELGMPALAITDHGNMYGVKEFFKVAKKYPEVKPIIGCEAYVSIYDHRIKDQEHRGYYHLTLLAKNLEGYHNLMKITSTGFIEGKYYDKPRVSHDVIEKYSKGLVCCSACLAGEVPRKIAAGDIDAAREAIRWHKRIFGEDYYLEVMLHRTEVPGLSTDLYEKQLEINDVIFRLAEEEGVKVVATNDVHFVRKEDGPAHDRLICLTTNANYDDPKRLRYTQQEYLKSEEEMAALFPDHPEVLSNTIEVAGKIDAYKIDRDPVLPVFKIDPLFLERIDDELEKYKSIIDEGRYDKTGNYRGDEFCKSVAFLCHLTYEGAHVRYGDTFTPEQAERIDFELRTICRMGFPDYFLIVQDFIKAARAMGVSVGPGRGSAAGSVVAYCLTITNVDPLRYSLLFERFLNPDRINLPDIDIDFDDEGRYRVFKYVEDTYGKDHISHVVTFGTMAAKSAVKDVARISQLSLAESVRLTKLIPDRPFTEEVKNEEGEKEEKTYPVTLPNTLKFVKPFKYEAEEGDPLVREVIDYATQLEGSIRQTGVHACALIIGRGDLTDYIPVRTDKDKLTGEDVWVSQYEGSFIEEVGMLKMDFLGLRTLSIIKECLRLIKDRRGIDIDIEAIDINDKKTFELYSRGDTTSVFQFESPGMRSWLQKLQPERFEDLIAMNALYRPGPMDYIPDFVDRKLGLKPVAYDLPEMEEYLKDTYGITVYQEQVMLLSQKLAGFTKGQADTLRKAMGKKKIDVLNSLYDKFMEGGISHGHPKEVLDKIWSDWKKFAAYAFNKSHATCYAWVSFQTAYLKANFPEEFQAANLTNNIGKMDEIQKIMGDCKVHNIKVLNPDVNESENSFAVNSKGEIRFGLGAIKGFGSNVIKAIIDCRTDGGSFADVFEFMERMSMYKASDISSSGVLGRKGMECLLYSGALDSFGYPRAMYFQSSGKETFLDALISYGEGYRQGQEFSATSLFAGFESVLPERPQLPKMVSSGDVNADDSIAQELLVKEKECVGMYLSDHPLSKYASECRHFTTSTLSQIPELIDMAQREQQGFKCTLAGYVTKVERKQGKSGKEYARVVVEDFDSSYELSFFGRDYENMMKYLYEHTALLIECAIEARFQPKDAPADRPKDYDLRVKDMSLLSNAFEERSKAVKVNIYTNQLTSNLIAELQKCVRKHKGHKELCIVLRDKATGYVIPFKSRKFSVAISSALLDELSAMGFFCEVI